MFALCLMSTTMVVAEELKTKIYDPFLTGLIDELNQRFSPHYALASKIRLLLPSLVKDTTFEDFKETFGFYEEILPHQDLTLFETEYEAWKCKWSQAPPLEDDLLQTLDGCDATFFPIIRALLQVLATLPVSTATPERSFSSLKYLKTYLRSTTTEERLTGLALLYINRQTIIDVEEVIQEFIKRNRRISFT
ncbi:unnamed protein product [Cylicostephanus goldi]|uniref:HAT C-terminal dimerisation domain-containing protein n=1 Tax=Cylicostephanus goldi TaxID=71465 RepID=A0A3P7MKS6_CYLGO|nr:unnamed protein product [Cylicostephanus goldi]